MLIWTAFFVITILGIGQNACAYKWVLQKPSHPIPQNATHLHSNLKIFIGRVQYLNTVQLVEVHNQSYVIFWSHSKAVNVADREYEILAAENCSWTKYDTNNNPEDFVRGGTAWNGEPVYVGRTIRGQSVSMTSIFLTSNRLQKNPEYTEYETNIYYAIGFTEILVCNENHNWVDSTSSKIPENSVIVPLSPYQVNSPPPSRMYVARLLGNISFVPATVTPDYNTTSGISDDGHIIKSFYNQVLIADPNKYEWKKNNETIPDYAVICGKDKNNELMYICRREFCRDSCVSYVTFTEIINTKNDYDFLVRIV